jgi:hypothetical protein
MPQSLKFNISMDLTLSLSLNPQIMTHFSYEGIVCVGQKVFLLPGTNFHPI